MEQLTVKGYLLEDEVGKGAGSWIYRAKRLSDRELVAIKIVVSKSRKDTPFLHQIRNEYEVASRLEHPHLIKILGYEEEKKVFGPVKALLFMEFVEGPTLENYKYRDIRVLLDIFIQVASALQYMHTQDFIHSDVKPSNILLKPGPFAKLIDFGLACRRGIQKSRVQGTIDFIAPEQVGKGSIDERTDVYNFAATMYRILTGRNIPSCLSIGHDVFVSHKLRIPQVREFNRDVPQVLEDVIMRSLSPEKADRPESIVEVHKALAAISEKLSHRAANAESHDSQGIS